MKQVWLPMLLTVQAGLATGIGGLITLCVKKQNARFLSVSMGFSAGVMIYVSMVELIGEGGAMLAARFGEKTGALYTAAAFFGGMLLIALIDVVIPDEQNPHELSCNIANKGRAALRRTGMMAALAVAVHNFPEGLASFVSAQQSLKVALPVVIAIGIHNIPEGISIAMPLYYGGMSRKKSLFYTFLAGLSEPLGALIGYLMLRPFLSPALIGFLYAAVAGIMVFISFDELLPGAEVYGEHHLAVYGLVGGMLVMALSLWLFL